MDYWSNPSHEDFVDSFICIFSRNWVGNCQHPPIFLRILSTWLSTGSSFFFSKSTEIIRRCLLALCFEVWIRRRELIFLLYGPDRLLLLANQIILISHINTSVFYYLYYLIWPFFLDYYTKIHQKQKSRALDIVEFLGKEMLSVSSVTCAYITVQASLTWWSIFSFIDMPTLKLRIIIILPNDRPEIIPPTACTTKNQVALALDFINIVVG